MYAQDDMKSLRGRRWSWLWGLLFLAVSGSGHALVITGGSSSYALGVNLTVNALLIPPLTLGVGPLPTSAGFAPDPYYVTNSALAISLDAGLVNLTTGLLETAAASNLDGMPGDKIAIADARVHGLGLGVLTGLLGGIGLNTGEIDALAYVGGDYGSLYAGGSSYLANASLNALLISLGLSVTAAPNTHVDVLGLLGLLGLSVILNEQIVTGDGVSSIGMTVNAIHIGFHDFLAGLGLINGDIVISHSEAWMEAVPDYIPPTAPGNFSVPEPGTLALTALAAAALARSRRRAACPA